MFKYRIDRIPKPKLMPEVIRGSDTLIHAGDEYKRVWQTFHTYRPEQGEILTLSVWYEDLQAYKPHHWIDP